MKLLKLNKLFTKTAPVMLSLKGKGLECIDLLGSRVAKDMRPAVVASMFPAIEALARNTKFTYPSSAQLELCGHMVVLAGVSGVGKGELTRIVKAITRSLTKHDDEQLQAFLKYQKEYEKKKGSTCKKEAAPDLVLLNPPANISGPGFTKNAMFCENAGNYTFFMNIPEIEMLNSLCGGHKRMSETIRFIFDVERMGQVRATADGVTGNPTLRVCICASTTPGQARKFFKYEMHNGTFNRFQVVDVVQGERKGEIPVQGEMSDEFLEQLDTYLARMTQYQGTHRIPELNELINALAKEMADYANLTDDDKFFALSHRSLIIGFKVGCTLWLLNNCEWEPDMAKFVVWIIAYDLWSKYKLFGDRINEDDYDSEGTCKCGPKNMLDNMGDTFSEQEFAAMCLKEKTKSTPKGLLKNYKKRKYIEFSNQTGLYTKTAKYLKMIGR